MFAGTAAADGKTKRIYKPGPAPLNISCPAGYTKDKLGQCIRLAKTCPSGYNQTRDGQCVRPVQRAVSRPAPRPVVRPAPQPVRTVPAPRPAPVPQQASLDLLSLTGGVGVGIDSGFVGGNGFATFDAPARFSGVTDAPAAVFTFNQAAPAAAAPVKNVGGGKRGGGARGGMGGRRGGMGGRRGGMGGGKRGGMGGKRGGGH